MDTTILQDSVVAGTDSSRINEIGERSESEMDFVSDQGHLPEMTRPQRDRACRWRIRNAGSKLVVFCLFWSNYAIVEAYFFFSTSHTAPIANHREPCDNFDTRKPTTHGSNPYRHLTSIRQSSSSQSSSPSPPSFSSQSSVSPSSPSAAHLHFARSFRSILARNKNHHRRQRFVTGEFPVFVTVEDNPTRRWLDLGGRVGGSSNEQYSTSVVLVNGTNIDRSLASYDRYQWLDDTERQELHNRYATVSMELLAEISIEKPGYLQILGSDGAGYSASVSRKLKEQRRKGTSTLKWNKWIGTNKNTKGADGRRNDWDTNNKKVIERPRLDRLWSTGFSLTSSRGIIKSVNIEDGHIDEVNLRSESMIPWPNEVTKVPTTFIRRNKELRQPVPVASSSETANSLVNSNGGDNDNCPEEDALLVADGFLVPGKDRGGVYVVQNPTDDESEWSIPLTDPLSSERWFYHKATWVDLTGDGRQSILTARAKLRKVASTTSEQNRDYSNIYLDAMQEAELDQNLPKNGQLIWLEMPKPHRYDVDTGTPLEEDGTAFDPFDARHLPWKERVLVTGPDVTFSIADMNPDDDTIEVLASQFFDEKVTLHSIRRCENPEVTFSRVIDESPGAAFGGILVDLDPTSSTPERKTNSCGENRPRVVDSGSTVKSLNAGDSFSHFLVTSHEFNSKNIVSSDEMTSNMMGDESNSIGNSNKNAPGKVRGGSLLAYKVPKDSKDAWKTEPWIRTTIASGFQVKQQIWNVINPGAPGFTYAFYAHKDDEARGKRPMIAVAGDCAESAYIFRPQQEEVSDFCGTSMRPHDEHSRSSLTNNALCDAQAQYKLMCEIKCGATVGSIAVGYEDLCSAEQEEGYAKIYIPCFEKDKILVFALGSGEEEDRTVDLTESGW